MLQAGFVHVRVMVRQLLARALELLWFQEWTGAVDPEAVGFQLGFAVGEGEWGFDLLLVLPV